MFYLCSVIIKTFIMKYLLIIGNITFHHFTEEEEELFKVVSSKPRALVHETLSVQLYDDLEVAYQNADDAESYLLFPNFIGEVVFENDKDRFETIKEIERLIDIENISTYSESLTTALQIK